MTSKTAIRAKWTFAGLSPAACARSITSSIAEDLGDEVARAEVANAFGMGDDVAVHGDRLMLGFEVGAEDFLDILADPQPAKLLEIGKALEEQDALGDPIGVLHLVDRFVALIFGELVDSPIVEHPIVKPILVDRRQLGLERPIEKLDDPWVALHYSSSALACALRANSSEGKQKNGGKLRKICY
jgi:hypothetical protein